MNYRHDQDQYKKLSGEINPLLSKKNVDSVAKMCANMLAESCFELHPELERLKQDCQRFCGMDVCLSGSGSAMYVLVPGPFEKFLLLQEHVKKEYNCESRFIYNNRW